MARKTTSVSVSIEPGLLKWVDNIRGDTSRSKFICRVLKNKRTSKIRPLMGITEIKGDNHGIQRKSNTIKTTCENITVS